MANKWKRLGFIGAGNMAGALIRGLLESGLYDPHELAASDADPKRLTALAGETGIRTHPDNPSLVLDCTAVVLAVKPQVLPDVLLEIRDQAAPDLLVISVAAGIPLSLIREGLGRDLPLVRVMPNTPALVGRGMSALAPGERATGEHLAAARALFEAVGETLVVEESMMNAVTAVSGSGPGYLFRIMEALVEAGEDVGFERDEAVRLVVQTVLGAAHLAAASDRSLAELREMVTSPGGTTAAGLAVLDEARLGEILTGAVRAARDRAVELGGPSKPQ
jgi:pyrroline-5-carboxylate reductase